jgi:acetyltransferase
MKSGVEVERRTIRPDAEPLMLKFHQTLSDSSVHLRCFHLKALSSRVAHRRLIRRCKIDYENEMALVVDHTAPESSSHEILGVSRVIVTGVSTTALTPIQASKKRFLSNACAEQ